MKSTLIKLKQKYYILNESVSHPTNLEKTHIRDFESMLYLDIYSTKSQTNAIILMQSDWLIHANLSLWPRVDSFSKGKSSAPISWNPDFFAVFLHENEMDMAHGLYQIQIPPLKQHPRDLL
jgi:hypothetical protein